MDSLWTRGVVACLAATCLGWPAPAPGARAVPRASALRADLDGRGAVRLRWHALEHAPVAAFAVYRRVVADAAGAGCPASWCVRRRVAHVNRSTWTDHRTRAGFRYRYWVAVVGGSGVRGALSRPALVTIPVARPPAGSPPAVGVAVAPAPVAPAPEAPSISAPAPPVVTAPSAAPAAAPPATTGGAAPATPATPADPAAARFVAVNGTDRGTCVAARPCASFGYAYQVARPGEVVAVGRGSYPIQTIPLVAARTGAPVVFRPAAGAQVSTAAIEVYGSHVELRDLVTRGWYVKEGASDVTFREVTVSGGIFITSASHVRVLGGSVGPGDSVDSQIKAADNVGAPVPSDILIDGVDFHDWTRVADPSAHVECLQIGAGVRITIRNSKFRDCETHGLFVRSWGGTARIADLDIERNWFGATNVGYYALRVAVNAGVVYQRIRVAYNTALQPLHIDQGAAKRVTVVGNTVSGGR